MNKCVSASQHLGRPIPLTLSFDESSKEMENPNLYLQPETVFD